MNEADAYTYRDLMATSRRVGLSKTQAEILESICNKYGIALVWKRYDFYNAERSVSDRYDGLRSFVPPRAVSPIAAWDKATASRKKAQKETEAKKKSGKKLVSESQMAMFASDTGNSLSQFK